MSIHVRFPMHFGRCAVLLFVSALLFSMPILSQTPSQPELTGTWQGDQGRFFEIREDGSTVTSTRVEPMICEHTPGQTNDDFVGTRSGLTITGQVKACRWGEQPEGVVDVPFNATIDPCGEQITGTYHDSVTGLSGSFTLVRKCKACKKQKIDLKKACASLDEAAKLPFSYISADSPYKGKKRFKKFKKDLLDELNNVKIALCGKKSKKAMAELEKIKQIVEAMDESEDAKVRSERNVTLLNKVEDGLLNLKEKINCAGPCPKDTQKKTKADDKQIEKTKTYIRDNIKQINNEILKEASKSRPGTKTDKLNKLKKKVNRLQKTMGAWDKVNSAQCVPPKLMNATMSYIHEKQNFPGQTPDECNTLCSHLGKWVSELTGEDIQQKTTTEDCLALCN